MALNDTDSPRAGTGSGGCTIIELMVAVSLATVLFVGLAALMGTALRSGA